MKYKIAVGSSHGLVETRDLTWDSIAARLTRHEASMTKAGRYFVGGAFSAPERVEANLICRTLITLDLDQCPLSMDDIEEVLTMGIDGAFVAYSTFSHSDLAPKIRVVVPLSREVAPREYPIVARQFAETLAPLRFDPASFVANAHMYLPRCPRPAEAWTMSQGGDPWQVPDGIAVLDDPDDLEAALAAQPLDLSDDTVDAYLSAYDPEGLEYDAWLRVGMALHHQYEGREEGYTRWLAWSERSSKHDAAHMPSKWRSFGRHKTRITFASVIHFAKLGGAVVHANGGGGDGHSITPEFAAFEALAEGAAAVDSVESYDAFKARVRGMAVGMLPLDKRALLAAEVYAAWGKSEGLTRADIKRAFQPPKRAAGGGGGGSGGMPSWMRPWVYVESCCQFYHRELHYGISREAFDAKHSREIECVAAECSASRLALVDCGIETVVDLIFWPGAGERVEYEGRSMLNVYREQGVVPADVIDADGQDVIDGFLRHVEFLIEREDERRILIDFLAWIVQRPGEKINWSILLQGGQGCGKSYFGELLMQVLGGMARNLEPAALGGRFTSWAFGALAVIVEEVRVAGESKFAILDRLKPFIANATVQIEEKGRDIRTVPNFTSYLMFSNHKDALPIADGDRRYAPIFSRIQTENQLFDELGGREGAETYFNNLFSGLTRRADALSRFLRDWVISPGFAAKGRAPKTSATEEMVELSVSPARELMEDLISKHECEVINDQIIDLTWLATLHEGEGEKMPQSYVVSSVLLEMGYRKIKGRRVKCRDQKLHYVWVRCAGGDENDEVTRQKIRAFHAESI